MTPAARPDVTLDDFIAANRDEIIRRCRAKVARRPDPPATDAELADGVPHFLDQLVKELRQGPSNSQEIGQGGIQHGHDLRRQGFTIGQVVHDYGDICQSVTGLAVELSAPISTDDFRTLNRCLDDAIAGAVTEYARADDASRDGTSHELRNLTDAAITAFEVLQTGTVGVGGSTGAVVHHSLLSIRALIDRPAVAS
jgi:hypothetical protein